MELYLDTADVTAVKRLARILPLHGVTTNPSIVAKEGKPIWEVLPALRDALGGTGKLFAQVMAADAERMVAEASLLSQRVPGLVVKIPATAEGLAAIKKLKRCPSRRWAPRCTVPGRGCWPPWPGRNMWRLTSIGLTRRAATVLKWCTSCSSC